MTGLIVAPTRSARPNDIAGRGARCPFCPDAPKPVGPVLAERETPEGDRLLVVENAFPILAPPGQGSDLRPEGLQEVVIEGARHEMPFSTRSVEWMSCLFRLWQERMEAVTEGGKRSALAFRNEGRMAGASLSHPHSQIAGLHLQGGKPESLSASGDHAIADSGSLSVFVPCTPLSQGHVRIACKPKAGPFRSASGLTLRDLGQAVRNIFDIWGRADFKPDHQIIVTESADSWRLDIIACTDVPSAFERATGLVVLGKTPSDLARDMRAVWPTSP